MANFNLKVDLGKFWGSKIVTTKDGKDVLVIPLEENFLVRGKNGSVYTNLQATEKKQIGSYGDSHFIKPRFSKETFAQLTEEQRNSIPFLGAVYYPQNNRGGGYATQTAYTPSVNASDVEDFF